VGFSTLSVLQIAPLEKELLNASRDLQSARDTIVAVREEYSNLDIEVQELKNRFSKTTAEAEVCALIEAITITFKSNE
jgi:regulator of replication initiation timing